MVKGRAGRQPLVSAAGHVEGGANRWPLRAQCRKGPGRRAHGRIGGMIEPTDDVTHEIAGQQERTITVQPAYRTDIAMPAAHLAEHPGRRLPAPAATPAMSAAFVGRALSR